MSDITVPPNLSAFMAHLQCPDCGGGVTGPSPDIVCAGCGRGFEITADGILCMLPGTPKPLSAAYDDPDYKKMSAMFDDAQDYFTDGNSVFNAIHVSSHETVRRWMRSAPPRGDAWICDLGCGSGFHIPYFAGQAARLIGIDIRLESLGKCRALNKDVILIQADLTRLPVHDGVFQAMLSIYALEHVYHLSDACDEIVRTVADGGDFYVGLPCEGGLAWNMGRKLTSERAMSKRYDLDYRNYIKLEHCNDAADILSTLKKRLTQCRRTYYPLSMVPAVSANLTVTAEFHKYKL